MVVIALVRVVVRRSFRSEMEEVDWRWLRRDLRVGGGRVWGVRMVDGSCLLLMSSGLVWLVVEGGKG